MALTPSFTISNNNNVNPAIFTITDTSLGADGNIATRKLLLYDDANNLLFTIPFPLSAGAAISPIVLDKDYAVNAVFNWLDSGGNVLYTSAQILVFTGFLLWFYYGLWQIVFTSPNKLNNQNFLNNTSALLTLIDTANQAITIGQSVANAQSIISEAQEQVANSSINY